MLHERVDGVPVSPHVVDGHLIRSAQDRQVLKQPLLAPIDGLLAHRDCRVDLDQGTDAQRSHGGTKCMMGTGHRREDVQVLGAFGSAPGTVLVLVREQELHAALDRLLHIGRGSAWPPEPAWEPAFRLPSARAAD